MDGLSNQQINILQLRNALKKDEISTFIIVNIFIGSVCLSFSKDLVFTKNNYKLSKFYPFVMDIIGKNSTGNLALIV